MLIYFMPRGWRNHWNNEKECIGNEEEHNNGHWGSEWWIPIVGLIGLTVQEQEATRDEQVDHSYTVSHSC